MVSIVIGEVLQQCTASPPHNGHLSLSHHNTQGKLPTDFVEKQSIDTPVSGLHACTFVTDVPGFFVKGMICLIALVYFVFERGSVATREDYVCEENIF